MNSHGLSVRNEQNTLAPEERTPIPVPTKNLLSVNACPSLVQYCLICGADDCALITHRILRVDFLKRASKINKTKKNLEAPEEQEHRTLEELQPKQGAPRSTNDVLYRKREQSTARMRLRKSTSGQVSCRVCHSPACQLVTHKWHTARFGGTSLDLPDTPPTSPNKPWTCSTSIPKVASGVFARTINASAPGVIGFGLSDPNLQPPTSIGDSSWKQAFYDFFSAKSQLMADPQRTGLYFDKNINASVLAQALANDTLYMSVVSLSAAFSADRRAQAGIGAVSECTRIFNKTCQLISRDIGNSPNESTLVAVLSTAVAQGTFPCNRTVLQTHLRGAREIISSLGGPTRIKGEFASLFRDIAYAATVVDAYVLDVQDSLTVIPLTDPPEYLYGWNLDHLVGILDHEICRASAEMCRVTELLEDQAAPLVGGMPSSQSRFTYFQYLRGILFSRLARLHTVHRNTDTIEECVNLALNLFTLSVLSVSPYRLPQARLCSRIQAILSGSNGLHSFIQKNPPHTSLLPCIEGKSSIIQSILAWVLFIVSATIQQIGYKVDECVLDMIMDMLSEQFQCSFSEWCEDWRDTQLLLLKSFCWSDVFLAKSYNTTCDMLVARASVRWPND